MNERASQPAFVTSAADGFEAQIQQAQNELLESVDKAGLGRDPYRFAVGAIAHTLGFFPSIVRKLEAAAEGTRQPVDPDVVNRIEAAAALGADRRAGQLVRARDLRTGIGAAAVFVVSIGAAGAVGYFMGRQSQIAVASAAGAAAGRDGPEAAATWLKLMQSNDGRQVARICAETTAKTDSGRRACALGLWVEPPPNVAPRTAPS